MLYAIINFFSALYLYIVQSNPTKHTHAKWLTPLIWILLSLLMRDSYPWDKSFTWPHLYVFFFILTGVTISFATSVFVAQFPSLFNQKYNKPMLQQSLFVLISILSISLFILDFTME
ncbi:hypothetical protein PVA44_01420 [Entomospira nematocerorum]|uniref:Uncharacterized protein n=1 Tax=Entomospira nematocerorum TaxID=2719987 RepID=A0A968GDZ5_9SPIO|nr:hypothetical protein [Entomospira nematocera]NIZ47307.1 hypothetical protein [Entomospira nematocera]WDI34151.1 hypothetical protein PVA44_01420 [Entomospira nematocera]